MLTTATTGNSRTPLPLSNCGTAKTVLAFFGGKRPIHISDALSGHPRAACYPGPIHVSAQPCALAPVRVRSRARPHDRRAGRTQAGSARGRPRRKIIT